MGLGRNSQVFIVVVEGKVLREIDVSLLVFPVWCGNFGTEGQIKIRNWEGKQLGLLVDADFEIGKTEYIPGVYLSMQEMFLQTEYSGLLKSPLFVMLPLLQYFISHASHRKFIFFGARVAT